MPGTPRERARIQTMADITRIGRKHLSEQGAAALSLRAVARDLGVVSSAVYRYVHSRDELLTLLVVDAYNELGDHVDAALTAVPDEDPRTQFRTLGRAVREWALREPACYALLYGSPVPGYHAPAQQTTGPGTRVIVTLIAILERAYTLGVVDLAGTEPVEPVLARDIDAIRAEYGVTAPDTLLARGLTVWSALFGAVGFEVFDQYGHDTFTDPSALFGHHLDVFVAMLGFR